MDSDDDDSINEAVNEILRGQISELEHRIAAIKCQHEADPKMAGKPLSPDDNPEYFVAMTQLAALRRELDSPD